MKITKTVAIPPTQNERAIFTTSTVYTSKEGHSLLQEYTELVASDTFGECFVRRSDDNGKTWAPSVHSFTPEIAPEGVIRRGEATLFLDRVSGNVLRFFNLHCYPGGTHTSAVLQLSAIWYEVSSDGGITFNSRKQIIVDGHTETQWAPDVEYGINSMMISFTAPLKDRQGRIILPVHFICPQSPGQSSYAIPMEAACFIGTHGSSGEIRWQIGTRAKLDSSLSCRGVFEPTIEELADGTLLMVCRGSNANMMDVPGRKWVCRSYDGGLSWSDPTPFLFDDGTTFYSPSSGSRLIRHSRTGALYWIGNLSDGNPDGNLPRYPLWIGEVNTAGRIVKASLHAIDDRNPGDSERVQLSNFRIYEDRFTGELVIHLARVFERSVHTALSPAYEYRVAI